ncbi:regulator of G-protein signaling 22-like isoform X2 [Apostichopus japonicus]|uniref:regulator of G-protein signaling 22-like isoform X2 n=1 Tax=Stichopus japonicus TaxID=307972 RepID=UPI003AB6DAC1
MQIRLIKVPDLKTSFKVQCLNKDQGIQWIKEERLPAFLQSDCYLEYRLARLISQTEIASKETDCPLNLYIDPEYKPFAIEKPFVEVEEVVDEKQLAMRNMYVCMGDAVTTQTDDWFSQVKMSSTTNLTTSTGTRPSTASAGVRSGSRPLSELSGRETLADSGVGSTGRISATGDSSYSVTFEDDLPNRDRLLRSPLRTRTPPVWRPPIGEDVCVVADGAGGRRYSGKGISGDEAILMELGEDDAASHKQLGGHSKDEDEEEAESGCDVGSQVFGDDQEEEEEEEDEELNLSETNALRVHSLDDLAMLIISQAVKGALVVLYNPSLDELERIVDENILRTSDIKTKHLDEGWMERLELASDFGDDPPDIKSVRIEVPAVEMERSVSKISMTISSVGGKDQGDTDSLFDSDNEDDAAEPDTFFSRPPPSYDLTTLKGIEAFKKFLWGTAGEKCWNLWLDVDKGKTIKDPQVQQIYLSQLREKYLNSGGLCELPVELKDTLGLAIPSRLTSITKLGRIQAKIAKPLLLYWAPRFLMKEAYQCRPGSHYAYHQRRLQAQHKPEAYQEPRSFTLLPLRPKTCMPRLRGPSSPSEITSKQANQSPRSSINKPQIQTGGRRSLPFIPLGSASTALVPKSPAPPTADPPRKALNSLANSEDVNPSPKHGNTQTLGPVVGRKLVMNAPEKLKPPLSVRDVQNSGSSEVGNAEKELRNADENKSDKKRPSSAAESTTSQESEFLGGRRMESLLDGLYHEKKAGGFFMKYLEKIGNEVYINCLSCWHELQEYHTLFYTDAFSTYALARKAQEIHSKFIVEGCFYSINCPQSIKSQVYREAIPPFEELFDGAEEHIFQVLVTPWSTMKELDKGLYDKIQLTEEERQLEGVTSRHLQKLQRRLNRERMFTPDFQVDSEDEEAKREAYYTALADKIPPEYSDFDFNKLIHNRLELENFRNFLDDNYALMDLLCWLDIESFRRTPHLESVKRDGKAKDIKTKYLNKKYYFGSKSPATRKQQNEAMMAGGGWGKLLLERTPTPILLEVQKHVRERLERKWLPIFICTEGFQSRQSPNMKLSDLMDDLLFNRRKRSQAIYKILESRWVSSSKEIISFRQALQNPFTCQQFRKFVSVKGENLENNVLFWLEVQKFKEMYHSHTEESLIHQKITAIIRCFIDSEIQPSLHIDITPEQADKILDKRPKEMGPYVFRDSQLTVFRVLFSHWNEFLKYRNTIAEDKVLEDLERKKRRQKKKEAEQRRLDEEKELKASVRMEDDRMSISSRRMSRISGLFVDFLEEEEDEEKVQWKYSEYVNGLEREQQLLNGDDRASSIMSSITNLMDEKEEDSVIEKEQGQDRKDVNGKIKAKGNVSFKTEEDIVSVSQTSEGVDPHPPKTKKRVTLIEPGKEKVSGPTDQQNGSGIGRGSKKGTGRVSSAANSKQRGQNGGVRNVSRPSTSKRR